MNKFSQKTRCCALRIIALTASMAFGVLGNAHAQAPSDTLPPYRGTTPATADSVALVEAASDALQGLSSLQVPMVVEQYVLRDRQLLIRLMPLETSRVTWVNRGGVVRILHDGRRLVLSRK